MKNTPPLCVAKVMHRFSMGVSKNSISFKHFQALGRRSKFIDAQIYSNAKSSSANRFLLDFVAKCTFKIYSIQDNLVQERRITLTTQPKKNIITNQIHFFL